MASPPENRRSPRGGLRASDADRERVAELLRDHYGAGRLSDEDLSERVDEVYGVRTLSELEALTADLPSAAEPPRSRRRSGLETSVRLHATVYIVVNLFLVGEAAGAVMVTQQFRDALPVRVGRAHAAPR